ncbi:MAG: histidine kinase [Bacteroidia bacterium]|nr:histidine kinase [Bacteroidia bacterium]
MVRLFLIMLISLLSLAASQAYGQKPMSINMNRAGGLPSDEVYNILQDKKGFIWITTDNGLYRYDGFEYKNYSSLSMSSKAGSYLQEDKFGRIWYSNFDGMIFYVENDSLKHFTIPELASVANEFVVLENNIIIKKRGNSLGIYDITSHKLKKEIQVSNLYYQIYKSHDLVNASDNQFSYLYDENWNLKFKISSASNTNSQNWISRIIYHNSKYYCLETETNTTRVYEVQGNTRKIIYQKSGLSKLINSFQIIDNDMWICTRDGMIKINLTSLSVDENLLPETSTSHIIKDLNGYFWVSSTSSGVYILPPQNNQFLYKNELQNFKLKEIDGILWAYSNKGTLAYFDTTSSSFNAVFQLPSHNNIYDLVKLDLGKIGFSQNLNLANIQFRNHNYFILSGGFKEIVEVNPGLFGIAVTGLAGIVGSQNNDWLKIPGKDEYYTGFQNSRCRTIIADVRVKSVCYNKIKDILYFATNSGIYYANKTTQGEIKYENNKVYANKISIFNNTVYFFLNNGEILSLLPNNTVEKNTILNSKAPYTFFKVQENKMFLCNAASIYWLNLDQKTPEFKSLSFGKHTSEINDITFYNNQFLFSTFNQVTKLIAPTDAIKNQTPFYINYIQGGHKRISNSENYEFKSTENDIVLHFSLLDYYTKNGQIQYKINNDNWKNLDINSRTLALASLNWGRYTVLFKINGIIQKNNVTFTILKPWYAQWWFISLICILILFGLYSIYFWRINENKKQNALLLEKVNLEKNLRQSMLSSIKSQMNPHFLFNALNTIQSFIVTEDKKNAAAYLSKFSKLTRSILKMSESETITVAEEIEALLLYLELEKMRFGDINYSLEIDSLVDTQTIKIPSMIIQPYVENSIKHGLLHKNGDKNLFIKISKSLKELIIVIEDNGIGREKSRILEKTKHDKHQSFASNANLKRIEILNQEKNKIGLQYIDKVDTENNSLGTKLTINIPLIEEK